MYRQAHLSCPACRAALTPAPGALAAHGCEACGGLWLGSEASVQILRGLDEASDRELDQASARLAERARGAAAIPEAARVCPVCDQPLARVDVREIRIDSCFTHGSWFDRLEVHEVIRTCSRLRAAQREDSLKTGFRWGVTWETFMRVGTDRR